MVEWMNEGTLLEKEAKPCTEEDAEGGCYL